MQLDKELQADVIRELEWEPKVDSANIGVAVDRGAVTLTGHVNTYTELIAAERASHGQVSSWSEASAARQAAESAPGVTKVDSQLTITP